ncbi:hypothetical protein ABT214_19720 [Micromonospora purpureochromogenes]|uniref:hypothetical protein n=1 Tax=Micromonospora purpureochromogenes TaxID=47872 RepID=UPI0033294F52
MGRLACLIVPLLLIVGLVVLGVVLLVRKVSDMPARHICASPAYRSLEHRSAGHRR